MDLKQHNDDDRDALLGMARESLASNFLSTAVERLRRADRHFIEEIVRTERVSAIGYTANAILQSMKSSLNTSLSLEQMSWTRLVKSLSACKIMHVCKCAYCPACVLVVR